MPAPEARAVGHTEAGKKKRFGRLNRFSKRNIQLYDAAVNNKFFAGFAGGSTHLLVRCILFPHSKSMCQALQENQTLSSVDWKIAKRGSNAIGFEYFRQRDTPAYVTRKLEKQVEELLAPCGLDSRLAPSRVWTIQPTRDRAIGRGYFRTPISSNTTSQINSDPNIK